MLEIYKEEVIAYIYQAGCYKDGGARIPKEFKHSVSEVEGIGKIRTEEKSVIQ